MLFELVIVAVFFGVILSVGLITLSERLGFELSLDFRQMLGSSLILAALLGVGYFRFKQYREKEVWCLEGYLLKRGSPVNLTVDLSQ